MFPDLCGTRTVLRKPIPQRFRCRRVGAAGAFPRRGKAFVTTLAMECWSRSAV
jgi:hypothetical protein